MECLFLCISVEGNIYKLYSLFELWIGKSLKHFTKDLFLRKICTDFTKQK